MSRLLLLCSTLFYLAACGGGDSGSAAPSAPPPTGVTQPPVVTPPVVVPVVTTISITPATSQLKTSQTLQFIATVKDQDGKEMNGQSISWSVSDTELASINNSGLLSAKLPGTVKVSARVADKSASQDLTVVLSAVKSVAVNAEKTLLIKDEELQLSTTVTDEFDNLVAGRELVWTTSDTAVLSVSSTGKVKALGFGNATISAAAGEIMGTVALQVPTPEFAVSCHPQLTLRPGQTTTFACSITTQQNAIEGLTTELVNVDPSVTIRRLTELGTIPANSVRNLYFSVDLADTAAVASYAASINFSAYNASKNATISINTEPVAARLHVLYIIPSDKTFVEARRAGIERAMRHGQIWFQQEMGNGKSFVLNKEVVKVLYSDKTSGWFQSNFNGSFEMTFWLNTLAEANRISGARQNDPANTWLLYIDADPLVGQLGGAGANGVSVLPGNDVKGVAGEKPDSFGICRWVGGMLHELGHALYLPHPPGCDQGLPSCDSGALMWAGYSTYPKAYLRDDEKSLLNQDLEIASHNSSSLLFDCENTGKYD